MTHTTTSRVSGAPATPRTGTVHLSAQARVRALTSRPAGPFRVTTAAPTPARPDSARP